MSARRQGARKGKEREKARGEREKQEEREKARGEREASQGGQGCFRSNFLRTESRRSCRSR